MCYIDTCISCSEDFIIQCEDFLNHLQAQPTVPVISVDYEVLIDGVEVFICPDCLEENESYN